MFSHIDFTEFIRQSIDDSLIVSVAAVRCVIVADFDGDDMIDKNDLKKVITRLTGVQVLESIDMDQLINNVCRLITILLAYQNIEAHTARCILMFLR